MHPPLQLRHLLLEGVSLLRLSIRPDCVGTSGPVPVPVPVPGYRSTRPCGKTSISPVRRRASSAHDAATS